MNYNAIVCAIARDETDYIVEWVDHHLKIGFEYIVIYDNNSVVPIKQTLSSYIRSGQVSVIDCPIMESPQMKAYNHCLYEMHNKTKWIAYIDIDEFIVLHKHDSIVDMLGEYEQYPGLCLNWVMHTANQHIHKPQGSIIDSYTTARPFNSTANTHIKTILQPKHILTIPNPHFAVYNLGLSAVNESGDLVTGPFSQFSNEVAQVNHYFTKSFEEWMLKIGRGSSASNNKMRRVDEFWLYNEDMLHLKEKVEQEFESQIEEYNQKYKNFFKQ